MPGKQPARVLRLLSTPLDALWRWCSAPTAAAILALAAAAAIGLGLALPQAPSGLAGDAQGWGRWLADLEMQRGAWVGWAGRAGLLSLYTSPGLRLLWAAIGFAALVATADRFLAWRAAARRGRPWQLLAHVGLLLLLLGALIDERWGWEQGRVLLGTGSPLAIGPSRGALHLERLAKDGAAPGVAVRWRQGEAQGQARLRPGWPLAIGLRTLHLQYAGPAAQLRAVDASGQAVLFDDPASGGRLQSAATLYFRQAGEARYLSVPARDWMVRVSFQPSAAGGSPLSLWVYRGLDPTPLAQAGLSGSGELAIAGTRLLWQVLPYANLRAALHPALGFWIAGWLVLCGGLAASPAGTGRGQAARLHWGWAAAILGLGSAAWVALGGLRTLTPTPAGLAGAAAAWLMALAAAILFLGALAGLPWALGRRPVLLAGWPEALGWGMLGWTVAGGLAFLARWAAEGTFWPWLPGQAWWGLAWCLLAGAWHLRSLRRRWVVAAGLAGLTALATVALAVAVRAGLPPA